MKILGISAFYHDSAAALVIDGEIIAAAQEERFTREKNTAAFPVKAIQFCLREAGLTIDDLDTVVFYDKPFLKFERLIETYYAFAPKGLLSFIKAMPVWLDEKLFLKRAIKRGLSECGAYQKKKLKLLFSEHHLAHAASSFFVSPFKESAILTIDGVGEWCTASIGKGNGSAITFIKEMNFPHSVGLLYSAFTYYLGFTVNSGEYKLMGLAPYGNKDSEQVKNFISIIKSKLVKLNKDGSIWLDQSYFNYATGLTMVKHKAWEKLFGFKKREKEEDLLQHHCDLAVAIQKVTEEIVINIVHEAKRLTGLKNLCLAGGVALNCVANSKIRDLNIFENIFIQPAAGDAGGALGAALAAHYIYFDKARLLPGGADALKGSYLGPSYNKEEVALMIKNYKAVFKEYDNFNELCESVSRKINDGKVVAWFQGKMEFGPRALGNRSILADARNPEMQMKLNLKIKFRESFRPFAPAVLEENANEYFESSRPSPYMLFVENVNLKCRETLPSNFRAFNMQEKLYFNKSQVPAVTHLDFSARVQTVSKDTNRRFWNLIDVFRKLTGTAILVNTSFNVRGEPMVCSPDDAYACFMATNTDILVINDFIFLKELQPDYQDVQKWKRDFKGD